MAAAAGIRIDWDDFSELSTAVPLLARVYPNGSADVNHFHAAGGLGFAIGTLLDAGLLHGDVLTMMGAGLDHYRQEPELDKGSLRWKPTPQASLDEQILRPAERPFAPEGGLRLMQGNLGRAVVKTSAVDPQYHRIEAPARVFDSQQAFVDAFKAGEFTADTVVVLTHQGPAANGMPELHKLMPYLGVLQSGGLRVALLTDGRLSGASGKVLAAIHVVPETAAGGTIGKLRDGDRVRIDAQAGLIEVDLSAAELDARPPAGPGREEAGHGMGRELFHVFRAQASGSESGATVLRGLGD
jgi:phosphogluconate dehydratase